jgi:DNA-binding CsgD family transcriptional regulator
MTPASVLPSGGALILEREAQVAANEEIAATGEAAKDPPDGASDALTASDGRVAQLAADGMSNKEIAQALFVTMKTVEVHLSHAYRKLEISCRAQLGKALRDSRTEPGGRLRLARRSPPLPVSPDSRSPHTTRGCPHPPPPMRDRPAAAAYSRPIAVRGRVQVRARESRVARVPASTLFVQASWYVRRRPSLLPKDVAGAVPAAARSARQPFATEPVCLPVLPDGGAPSGRRPRHRWRHDAIRPLEEPRRNLPRDWIYYGCAAVWPMGYWSSGSPTSRSCGANRPRTRRSVWPTASP